MPWLPGYEDSRPVRIGNAAHGQLQLDVFGEVMDALHQARKGGLRHARPTGRFSVRCSSTSKPSGVSRTGIWEVRGAPSTSPTPR